MNLIWSHGRFITERRLCKQPNVITEYLHHDVHQTGSNDRKGRLSMELLTSREILVWNDKYVFISAYTNLIAIVARDGIILQTLEIEGEKYIGGLFVSATIIGDKLILAPYRAKSFHIVDLCSKKQSVIPCALNHDNGAFLHTVNYGNKIRFIGENRNKVLTAKFEGDKLIFGSEYEYEDGIRWSYSYCFSGDRIIVPSRNTNNIMLIGSNDDQIHIVKTEDSGNVKNECYKGFTDLAESGNEIIIWDSCGKPHIMTIVDGKAKLKDAVIKTEGSGWRSVSANNKIYRFSDPGNKAYIISENGVKELNVKGIKDPDMDMNYFQGICFDDELIIFQNVDGEVFKLNSDDDSIETLSIRSGVDWTDILSKNMKDEVKRVGIIHEKYDNSLTAYLDMIENTEV